MRLAERNGSSAVAKAIMVKSGTRKKTNDRLIGSFAAFNVGPPLLTMTRTECRYQQSVIRKPCIVNGCGVAYRLNLRHGSQIGQCVRRTKKTAAAQAAAGRRFKLQASVLEEGRSSLR